VTKPRPVNEYDTILNMLVGSLVRSVNEMPEAQAMAGKVRLTKAEQLARYQANKDNPSFWADAVAKHGREGAYQMWKDMSQKEGSHAHEQATSE